MAKIQDFLSLFLGFTIMFVIFIIIGFLISLILVIAGIACFLGAPVAAIWLAVESNPYEKSISNIRKEYCSSEKPPETPRFYGA